jgi:class 3 adenylate cyclase
MVRMSLLHGNAPLSAFAYVCHGLALCGVLGDIDGGHAFGRLSARILELTQARDLTAKIFFLHNVFIRHWKEPLVDSLAAFEEAARAGMDSGDLEFSSYSLFHYCACSFLSGMDFATLEERVRRHQAIVEKHRLEKATWLMRLLQFQIMELKGDDAGLEKLRRIGFTEQSAATHWHRMRDHTSLCYLHAFAAMRRHLSGEFQESCAEARQASLHYASAMGQTFVPLYQFYEVLSICASGRRPSIRERWKMRGHLRRLKKWARHSPVNYGHKYLLACAEVHRVSGRLLRATAEYSQALTEARHHGFPHEEALVAERAAQLYSERGQPELALHYLRTAEKGYRNWGAGRLVRKLQEKQRALLSGEGARPRLGLMPVTDSVIDVAVISESYRMLSGEIEANRLVARLVDLLMKNAGAQRVVFIRLRDAPEVLAEGRAGEDAVLMDPPLRLQDYEEAPAAVLQYVMHSRTHLVLESARHDPAFMADPYIRRRQVQSVLCAPVLHQGQLTGMVYLENNLTPAAFTEERVKIVGMLAAQAGISMENAELLTSLEDKVRIRTVQLQEERDRSEHLLLNILPRTIADELKSAGKVQPRLYESASILFADIVGFTRISEENHPTELLGQLESVFFKFDEITERHGLEKLKQIGDAYMCAAGLPEPNATHAVDICLAALDFIEVLAKLAPAAGEGSRRPWGLRVGVHSGPVVAGVIGRRKFAYDVWGDTVNTASRMESTGVPGKINISNATRALVAGFFETEARGLVAAKGKGDMEMFFLTGIRADLHDHRRPNKLFGQLYRQLRNQ